MATAARRLPLQQAGARTQRNSLCSALPRAVSAPRRARRCITGASKAEQSSGLQGYSGPPELQEWDVVLFETPQGGAALGRVSQIMGSELSVERLAEDRTNAVWIVQHEEERLPLAAVRATVAADYLQLVDPDRVSNPHGEHALEAFRLVDPVPEALLVAAAAAVPGVGEEEPA